jgi:hypothetical protein
MAAMDASACSRWCSTEEPQAKTGVVLCERGRENTKTALNQELDVEFLGEQCPCFGVPLLQEMESPEL